MEEITLCVGLAAAALVLLLPPKYGILVYLVSLLCYPDYLRIIVLGCTVSTGRLIAMALLMRCLLDEQLRRAFRWRKIDTLVIAADAVYMLTLCWALGDSFVAGIKYQAGGMVGSTFAYFSARLIINNRAVLVHFVKVSAAVLVVMAFLGIFEAVTTESPYKGLLKYHFYADRYQLEYKFKDQEVLVGHGHEPRFGFFRAQGPHSHPIIFGASFAVFVPLVWKLFYNTRWKSLRAPVCGAIVIGGASSLSSTPFGGLLAALAGLAFERFQRWGKHLFVSFVLLCILAGIHTDSPHFYYVLFGRLSFGGGDGYYRSRLIDVALEHLPEYWLTGYGGNIGWTREISHKDLTDVTVHYVALAVMYGVFGLLAYLAIVFNLLFSLWRKYKRSVETFDRNICWALIVSIAVTLILDLGVAPFGVLPTLYSIIFGISGSVTSPDFNRQYALADTQDLLAASGT